VTPVNLATAAWRPAGDYALVLNETDAVYLYDPTQPIASRLSQVGSAGASVSWRAVTFTPDGSKAVLLGNTTAAGQIYLWDATTHLLTQMTTETLTGGSYQALEWSHDGSQSRLLASASNGTGYIAYLWPFDPATGRDLAKVVATATSAGCQDLAWATDGFGLPAVAVTCGVNGANLFYVDQNDTITSFTGNTGNTSRISARPQGDYALALCWSDTSVTFFKQGGWSTGFNNPNLPGTYGVRFASSGLRALFYGGQGKLYEFRDDLEQQSDFTDVSIAGFSAPPYNADSQAALNDVAWRPGCDGGLIVGGADTFSAKQALLIAFAVTNGVACPN
jgi:WD40 repeat protein